MASIAFVCKVDSSRISIGTRLIPKAATRLMVSRRLPSATDANPVETKELYMIFNGSIRSSLLVISSTSSKASSGIWLPVTILGAILLRSFSILRIVFRRRILRCPVTRRYFSITSNDFSMDAASSSSSGENEAFVMDMASSSYKISISFKKSFAALNLCASTTSLVTSGVTLGFPSRSPPIHDANLIGTTSIGRIFPIDARVCALNLRMYAGTASHKTVSITAFPPAASC
mmetsp:Transcript_23583/g.34935  ORF Transcript_23583/g.34935 Transcript_23583/m.34935 type:complete len:231 (-) Transcript_23583:764-1456(-)